MSGKNQLYFGDNLAVLREHIPIYKNAESVGLIYLDPPFNSRQDYNVLFAECDGTRSASQIMAFEDTWECNTDAESRYCTTRPPQPVECKVGPSVAAPRTGSCRTLTWR